MADLVKIINWSKQPSEQKIQKIVQVEYTGMLYALVGDHEMYHGQLLKRFLEKMHAKYDLSHIGLLTGKEWPGLTGPAYGVPGMGYGELNFQERICKGLYGNSADFGLALDPAFTKNMQETLKSQGWKGRGLI